MESQARACQGANRAVLYYGCNEVCHSVRDKRKTKRYLSICLLKHAIIFTAIRRKEGN